MTEKFLTQSRLVLETLPLVLAIFYVQSVLTAAHHTSILAHNIAGWTTNGPPHTVEPPALAFLIVAVLLSIYSYIKKGRKFSTLSVITLTTLAVSSIIWFSGLRTNFYF